MKTVAIVEDDSAVRESLTALLECSGYRTFAYSSAEAFLDDKENQGLTQFLIVDVRLPGMSGIELLESVKQKDEDLPAVVITGHANSDEFIRSPYMNRVRFLSKPCDPVRLLDVIEQAFQ